MNNVCFLFSWVRTGEARGSEKRCKGCYRHRGKPNNPKYYTDTQSHVSTDRRMRSSALIEGGVAENLARPHTSLGQVVDDETSRRPTRPAGAADNCRCGRRIDWKRAERGSDRLLRDLRLRTRHAPHQLRRTPELGPVSNLRQRRTRFLRRKRARRQL